MKVFEQFQFCIHYLYLFFHFQAMVASLAAENEEIEERDCIPECDVSPNGLLDEIFGVTRESK